jgi:hypothetical protein
MGMHADFVGHYPLTEDEYRTLWAEATIVLDTNALLNLYRYSAEARQNLIDALTQLKDRLWLPHQVAAEFHKHRLEMIRNQLSIGDEIAATLTQLANQAATKLRRHTKNAFFDISQLEGDIQKQLDEIKSTIAREHDEGKRRYGITVQKDPMLATFMDLYADRIGDAYPPDELEKLHKEAEARYKASIPPGYKDSNKGDDSQYGDYVLWRQILDHGKQEGRHLILVTDDAKEDWWQISAGETLGPRPELRSEYFKHTQGLFYLYKPAQFLSNAGLTTSTTVSPDVVEEISNTSIEFAAEAQQLRSRLQLELANLRKISTEYETRSDALAREETELMDRSLRLRIAIIEDEGDADLAESELRAIQTTLELNQRDQLETKRNLGRIYMSEQRIVRELNS